jgi:hypothetical protein
MEKKEIIIGRNPVLEYLNSIEDCTGFELHLSSTAHGKIIADIQNICKIKKVKALELTLRKLHVLMYPSRRELIRCISSFYFIFCFLFFI